MDKSNKELVTQNITDYYEVLFPELDIREFLKQPINSSVRRRYAADIDIPDVIEKKEFDGGKPDDGGSPPPIVPPVPPANSISGAPPIDAQKSDNSVELQKKVNMLENELSNIKNKLESFNINTLKDSVMDSVKNVVKGLQSDVNKFVDKRVPNREHVDTDNAYRDQLYGIACNLLDEILPKLFNEVPMYSFIATNVSKLFDDGSVSDALIRIVATVPYHESRYDFNLEMPVLNGILYAPLYLERSNRVIPLTKQDIARELNTISYRKMNVDKPYVGKENNFTNLGENPYRKHDPQKYYEVEQKMHKEVGIPENNKWKNYRNPEYTQ
jgi:hypothetical protein